MKRGAIAVICLVAATCWPSTAEAKGPWRVTVRGGGVVGEIDLMEAVGLGDLGFWFPNELLGHAVVRRPEPSPGPRFVVTWYAVGGAPRGSRPKPIVDRVAYFPHGSNGSGLVEVLVASGAWVEDTGSRWFVPRSHAAAALHRAVASIRESGREGVAGYVFVADGTGPGATARWEPLALIDHMREPSAQRSGSWRDQRADRPRAWHPVAWGLSIS